MKIIQICSVQVGEGYKLNGLDSNGKLYAWGKKVVEGKTDVYGWVLMEDQINNP